MQNETQIQPVDEELTDMDELMLEPVEYKYPSIERLRIILMGLMCINLFGFPTSISPIIETICGFVPIAFYIISGYLVLREEDDRPARIKRAIKRSFIAFVSMTAVYFVINYFYYNSQGIDILQYVTDKRFLFNFLFLNVWQFKIGVVIWYVQALLYAYIIIFFLEKLRLLKFDWLFIIVLLIITVISGELSGWIKWNILDYTYLPGNFFTRALPYILLGEFIHRNKPFFASKSLYTYILGIVFGVSLSLVEVYILGLKNVEGYYGHLIGMGITAFCACCLAFKDDDFDIRLFETNLGFSRGYTNIIYYICHPVGLLIQYLLTKLFSGYGDDFLSNIIGCAGILTFAVCFFFVYLLTFSKRKEVKRIKAEEIKFEEEMIALEKENREPSEFMKL